MPQDHHISVLRIKTFISLKAAVFLSQNVRFVTGETSVVCSAPARCDGNEERHHIACRGAVPQDLHTEARERQVSY